MIDDVLFVDGAKGARRVRLDDYLDPAANERALRSEYSWIKELRSLEVEGQPFRRRFTLRGDSLWWFAELYLHKDQAILNVFRTIAALETLRAREEPRLIRIEHGGPILRTLAQEFGRQMRIRCEDSPGKDPHGRRQMQLSLRARALTLSARLSRVRTDRPRSLSHPITVAAFVHRAFWQSTASDGSAESYIGPVLAELDARISDRLAYVGVGPTENFRVRRWWHPVVRRKDHDGAVIPIEAFAPSSQLGDSLRIWRQRQQLRRAFLNSAELRQHAIIQGYDCWPVVSEQFTAIAFLQWPWSARAMDEAGAALDALRPQIVVTYAEAGGWGRALMLEARRRDIPSVGLQHGFIYRSWLNYLHESDEMLPEPMNPSDRGFPAPDRTLVFDDYARLHLERHGRLSPESLVVTGSPRLDALVRSVGMLTEQEVATAREKIGASAARDVVLFVAKYSQSSHVLGPLVEAVARMPNVHLVIKAHPAETADVYAGVAGGHQNVSILPSSESLGPLLRATRVVVTVNSTVALDAGVVGVPALVIGLPNNLSPFVEHGVMAGAAGAADIEPTLRRILYDQEFRLRIDRSRAEYFKQFAIGSDGRAAARAADAVLALAPGRSERNLS